MYPANEYRPKCESHPFNVVIDFGEFSGEGLGAVSACLRGGLLCGCGEELDVHFADDEREPDEADV